MKRPEQWETLIKYVAAGMTIPEAARLSDMEEHTPYKRMKRDKVFADAMAKAQLQPMARAIATVQTAMKQHWQAACWWLERTLPGRFALRENLDVTSGGQSIPETLRAAFFGRGGGAAKADVRKPGSVLHPRPGDQPVGQTNGNSNGHPKP